MKTIEQIEIESNGCKKCTPNLFCKKHQDEMALAMNPVLDDILKKVLEKKA